MSGEFHDPEFPYTKTKRKGSKSPTRIVQPVPIDTRYSRSYIISIQGLLRLVIIVSSINHSINLSPNTLINYDPIHLFKLFQFAQWVSAAALPKNINGQYWLPSDFDQTRSACLFFSILGFLLSLIFYVCYALDFSSRLDESDMPLSLIVSIYTGNNLKHHLILIHYH